MKNALAPTREACGPALAFRPRGALPALAAALVAAASMIAAPASAAESLVSFEGGIGSQPLRAGALVNDVNGVPPGGRPWVISRLTAEVSAEGGIRVDGRGLLLAGGGGIGTPAGQSVRARLYCDNVVVGDSLQLVALQPTGDFRIDSVLSNPPPSVCKTPVLLILNRTGSWFAAGIPKFQRDAGAERED